MTTILGLNITFGSMYFWIIFLDSEPRLQGLCFSFSVPCYSLMAPKLNTWFHLSILQSVAPFAARYQNQLPTHTFPQPFLTSPGGEPVVEAETEEVF